MQCEGSVSKFPVNKQGSELHHLHGDTGALILNRLEIPKLRHRMASTRKAPVIVNARHCSNH